MTNESLKMTDGIIKSDKQFIIPNGVQQGAVNSPILFNIYNSNVLHLDDMNIDDKKSGISFADDLIIYYTDKRVENVQRGLENLFHKVKYYCHTWKLKINDGKCETILFKPKLTTATKEVKRNYKKFEIKPDPDMEEGIPHKNIVKYLGVNIDENLKYTKHIYIQLEKAERAFQILKNLFHNKHLNKRTKVICYMLLIRPIITYGCVVWFNQSTHVMEKLRCFERKCLRACLAMYRTEESDYRYYVSNYKLYDAANIPRIDIHIIKLIRDYWANIKNTKNPIIEESCNPEENYISTTLNSGYIPPEGFIHLDKNNYIQDKNGIPVIYHAHRRSQTKTITYDPNLNTENENQLWRYNKSIPNLEKYNKHRENKKKYWWLN